LLVPHSSFLVLRFRFPFYVQAAFWRPDESPGTRGRDAHRVPIWSNDVTVWRQLFTRRMLICVFTGFASACRCTAAHSFRRGCALSRGPEGDRPVDADQFRNWKFLWAPLVDQYALPVLGRRRGWMLLRRWACWS
jgi:hypothetical protein